jgi:hypothetical protein
MSAFPLPVPILLGGYLWGPTLKMEAVLSSERLRPPITLHSVTTQKITLSKRNRL